MCQSGSFGYGRYDSLKIKLAGHSVGWKCCKRQKGVRTISFIEELEIVLRLRQRTAFGKKKQRTFKCGEFEKLFKC